MENTSIIKTTSRLSFFDKIYRNLVHGAFNSISHGHIELVDGTQSYYFGNNDSKLSCTIYVSCKSMYKDFVLGGSVGAGESYFNGKWGCSNLTTLIEIFCINQDSLDAFEKKFSFVNSLIYKFKHLANKNSKSGSKNNIIAHYDLGNDLYSSFLSKEMLYSSAVYTSKECNLETAQQNKLSKICSEIDLQQSDRVIEIGTGWGAFAIYAAQNYGCHVTTTTISDEQYLYVEDKVKQLNLEDKITLLKQDYRDLEGCFDKLVSIEMIEAVGHDYLPSFFSKCSQLLNENGVMLIQAITIACQRYKHYLTQSDFIQQYIFPGGCLPSVEEMIKQISAQTDMTVHSISDIGLHYARTLNDWKLNFYESWPTLDRNKFDDVFFRLWEFYLSYCEGAFKQRAISTIHLVTRKTNYVSRTCTDTLNY